MPTYDVVVAGLGGFGSSAAFHLARRGLRVLGLDPRPGAHTEGASHGESRIVRRVYFEGAAYVPLLQRTYELWDGLRRPDGEPMLLRTGGLFMGTADSRVFAGSVTTAQQWDLDHEVLDAAEVAAIVRFVKKALQDTANAPDRPREVPSGLPIPADGFRIPR